MNSIYEIFTAGAMGMYWQEINANQSPYLYQALFPAKKKSGLRLKWIKGYKRLPIALMPSAFDAKPTLRDRIGVQLEETKMPFFREAMRIGEQDRQDLLTLLETNQAYVQDIVTQIFDDVVSLVDSAVVVAEQMATQLLVDAKISIKAREDSGIAVNYEYNYDPSGEWAGTNVVKLTGATDKWDDHENSKPIKDILTIKRKAKGKGVTLKRAILTTNTWLHLMENKSIKMDINITSGQNIILTDADLESYLLKKTGIQFVLYDNMYQGEDGTDKQFYPDGYVTFLPEGTLGNMWYGTTPEEADLMAGANKDAEVSIVNTGVSILTKKESLPVNVITSVSQIVLPSFENMESVFVLNALNVGG